jgi:hypothetical protein
MLCLRAHRDEARKIQSAIFIRTRITLHLRRSRTSR